MIIFSVILSLASRWRAWRSASTSTVASWMLRQHLLTLLETHSFRVLPMKGTLLLPAILLGSACSLRARGSHADLGPGCAIRSTPKPHSVFATSCEFEWHRGSTSAWTEMRPCSEYFSPFPPRILSHQSPHMQLVIFTRALPR